MAIGGSNPSGGVAPSAPPAGGVRNNQGINAQARGQKTQDMLRKQKLAAKRAGVKKPVAPAPGVTPTTNAAPTSTQKPNQNNQPASTPDKPKPMTPPKTTTSTFSAAPNPYQEKPDPRDENYEANVKAIEATVGVELLALERAQTQDDEAYIAESARLTDYNARRVRSMAESRLGTGASYTGGARREQIENATDFANNMGDREAAYETRMQDRGLERTRVRTQADRDIRELETETARLIGEQALDDSQNSSGDAVIETTTTPGTVDKSKLRLQKKIQTQTGRIKTLRERLEEADTPKQRERIRNQIARIRKRRTHAKGKLNKS